MKERFMIKCAVFLILTKIENNKEYILLQRRYNTGILDGQYDVSSSGHLENGETLKESIIRETKEEIGIDINTKDLNYVCTMHANFKNGEYLLVAFSTRKYKGIPKIMEINKCDALSWFDINNLPSNLIDTRKIMINNYLNNNHYNEYGFNYKYEKK